MLLIFIININQLKRNRFEFNFETNQYYLKVFRASVAIEYSSI